MLAPYRRFRLVNSTDQTITYNNGGRIEVACLCLAPGIPE